MTYSNTNNFIGRKNSRFISSERSDLITVNSSQCLSPIYVDISFKDTFNNHLNIFLNSSGKKNPEELFH